MTYNINVSRVSNFLFALEDKRLTFIITCTISQSIYTSSIIVLFACIFLGTFHASLAVYAATPMKLAFALPRFRKLMCVVAATAAH